MSKCRCLTQRPEYSFESFEVANTLSTDLCASEGQRVSVRRCGPIFELSKGPGREAFEDRRPNVGKLLVNRPVAAVALIPKPLVLFAAGAAAGALGEPFTFHPLATLLWQV